MEIKNLVRSYSTICYCLIVFSKLLRGEREREWLPNKFRKRMDRRTRHEMEDCDSAGQSQRQQRSRSRLILVYASSSFFRLPSSFFFFFYYLLSKEIELCLKLKVFFFLMEFSSSETHFFFFFLPPQVNKYVKKTKSAESSLSYEHERSKQVPSN